MTPILKNTNEGQNNKSGDLEFKNNCGKTTQSTCKETQRPFEMAELSMKRNQELPLLLSHSVKPIDLRGFNRGPIGGYTSVSPRNGGTNKET